MTAKQISVFLENKPGQLVELAKTLNQNNIDMRALSLADTKDFGIVRLIVDDPYKTACVLKEAGYISSITPVLAIEIPDEPGQSDAGAEPAGRKRAEFGIHLCVYCPKKRLRLYDSADGRQ